MVSCERPTRQRYIHWFQESREYLTRGLSFFSISEMTVRSNTSPYQSIQFSRT